MSIKNKLFFLCTVFSFFALGAAGVGLFDALSPRRFKEEYLKTLADRTEATEDHSIKILDALLEVMEEEAQQRNIILTDHLQ